MVHVVQVHRADHAGFDRGHLGQRGGDQDPVAADFAQRVVPDDRDAVSDQPAEISAAGVIAAAGGRA